MKYKSFRIIAVLFVCFLSVSVQIALASSVEPDENNAFHSRPTIFINGEKQDLKGNIPPSGSTVVPFREFFSVLKIQAQFDNRTKTLTAKSDKTTITLTAGKRVATLNGKEVPLLQSPSIENDTLYVNLRFIAESFDGVVNFNKSDLTINIDFPLPNTN